MNLTRCNNGHFYDMDKFDSCPHCINSAGGESDQTTPLSGPAPTNPAVFDDDGGTVTMPVGQLPETAPAETTAPTEPVTHPFVHSPVQKITPQKIDIPPVAPETSTKPEMSLADLVQNTVTNHNTRPEDQEKTVGIYSLKEKEQSIDPVVGWLVCIKGSAIGRSFNLKSGRNFIGRDSSMDVQIPGDKSISRQCHAVILYDPKSKMFLVQPGTSRELFYLNDKVVLGVEEVKTNDILTIGNTDLMFIPCCSENFCWEDQMEKIKKEEEEKK